MRKMNEKDQDQLNCTLMNVTHYTNFDDFTAYENMDGAEFIEAQESGFISDLTLGTYNGVTNTFQARTIDASHILEAILVDINEAEGYEMLADLEGLDDMTQADYIRAYSEFYKVFTLDGKIYVNKD